MTTIVTRSGKGSPLTHVEVDTNFTNLNTNKLEAGAIALGSAATPSISFTGDTNTGIYSPGADQLAVATNGSGRLFINSAGQVGIGATSPTDALQVANGNILIGTGGSSAGYRALYFGSSSTASARFAYIEKNNDSPYDLNIVAQTSTSATSAINFKTTPINTAATIDSSGRLLVGTSTDTNNARLQEKLALVTIGSGNIGGMAITNYGGTGAGSRPLLDFQRSRGTTDGSFTAVASGDQLGSIIFRGADGSQFADAAFINCEVDGTPGASDMPGRLVFSTTADGASSPTERLRITSAGVLQVADAGNITVGTTTGTKIGTATTQKLGFYNATPVVQPTAVADATDAASVIARLNDLLARLRTLGIIAT